jgi:UbiD family decarboxylase
MSKQKPFRSTRDFVNYLSLEKELLEITEEVDPIEELAEIQRRVCADHGQALLFTNVKGSKFPVATNLFGSAKRIEMAFGKHPKELIQKVANTVDKILPPSFKKIWELREFAWEAFKVGLQKVQTGHVLEVAQNPVDLELLPALKSWPLDGGRFITLPLVYTENPKNGKGNLGMYRVQFHDKVTAGMHIQIHRGGGFHYHEAEQRNESLPAHIYIGGPPAMTLAAIAPMPEEISELIIASLLLGEKLKIIRNEKISSLPIVADSDFLIIGSIPPHKRKPEGPFGDHYGYYAPQFDYPYLDVSSIYHRKDAIWPATVVGRPPQEDHYIAEYLQELLSPMFPIVMPKVINVWAYEESGVHTLAAAVVKERYHKEAFTAALRILGEGHLSLSKCLFITNENIDLRDFKKTFITILERVDTKTDVHIFSNISQDSLDFTGPEVNKGSKMIILGVGEKRNDLRNDFHGDLKNSMFKNPKVFVPGALVVQGPAYKRGDGVAETLLKEASIHKFPFVFLVDNSIDATKSEHDFLWTVFTRFEPAGDVYGNSTVVRNHISFDGSIVFDCRIKDWYPSVLTVRPEIANRVETRFGKLFK